MVSSVEKGTYCFTLSQSPLTHPLLLFQFHFEKINKMEFGIRRKYNFPLTSDPLGSGKRSCCWAPAGVEWPTERCPIDGKQKTGFHHCGLNICVDSLSVECGEAGGICPATLQPGEDSHRRARKTNIELVTTLFLFVLALQAQPACRCGSYMPHLKFGPRRSPTAFCANGIKGLKLHLKKNVGLYR